MIQSRKQSENAHAEERDCLERFIATLRPTRMMIKYNHVLRLLVDENWIERGALSFLNIMLLRLGCHEMLSKDFPTHKIGLYAGGDKSGLIVDGVYEKI